ncbi:thioesterase II family protein [Pseudomonas cerasi]
MHTLISHNRTVVRYSLSGAAPVRQQLVVFPHAGGSASFYQGWRTALPAECDLFVVNYPGREERQDDELWQSAPQALAACTQGLRELLGIAPVSFFGHSMGALLALQVASTLWNARFSCRRVVLSAQRVPAELVMLQQQPVRLELLDKILNHSEQSGIMQLDDLTRPIVAALLSEDLRLLGQLAALPVADIPLLITGGDDDPLVGRSAREGWSALVTQCQQSSWPGDHFYFQTNLDAFLHQLLH